ncbi:hypothetical protein LWI29_012014 [Acer saccharum]|uniref:Uncharacterized protein n=1 Tax=Acer saccharum TaxID=4024 RepID=A0AA39SS38_ACESA|nr:hypothetical protein LWI29_012014 [Acer saccharum]
MDSWTTINDDLSEIFDKIVDTSLVELYVKHGDRTHPETDRERKEEQADLATLLQLTIWSLLFLLLLPKTDAPDACSNEHCYKVSNIWSSLDARDLARNSELHSITSGRNKGFRYMKMSSQVLEKNR